MRRSVTPKTLGVFGCYPSGPTVARSREQGPWMAILFGTTCAGEASSVLRVSPARGRQKSRRGARIRPTLLERSPTPEPRRFRSDPDPRWTSVFPSQKQLQKYRSSEAAHPVPNSIAMDGFFHGQLDCGDGQTNSEQTTRMGSRFLPGGVRRCDCPAGSGPAACGTCGHSCPSTAGCPSHSGWPAGVSRPSPHAGH